MDTIYIEDGLQENERVKRILSRFKHVKNIIICQHYGEVFNARAQNFRLQKENPALILARKTNRFVLETPEGFGIGGQQNYYFSHMLNCIYDCRYCFLQGMYPSAHYVIFINYEEFMQDITRISEQATEPSYFFSGYDGDSLAFDDVTGFLDNLLPFFRTLPNAILELRTKSINVKRLLAEPALDNCVVAFSFTPQEISSQVEHGVPSVEKRINAMQRLAEHGCLLGLRFDPLIYADNYQELYRSLIDSVLTRLDRKMIHSVSIGPMRFPSKMHQKLINLYPQDKLMAHPLQKRGNLYSYSEAIENEMKQFVTKYLQNYLDDTLLFSCNAL